ncbi:MAG: response regulator [Planctomycetes bacterium]|nr:response regulator [Planctomycetota bacterium]
MAKVVLIDDEARLLATLARFLERQGLEVVQARTFAEADEHLQPGRFEVLVTDIVMPDYDGIRVLREVVEERNCQEPVILITGEPNLETASQAVRSGAFDYIQKPVTKDRLLEVVNRGLRHVKVLRERDHAQQRELQLLKNLAEIGESASVLSHEIKTPINGLRHALRAVGDKLGVEDGVLIEEFVGNLGRIERLLGETLSFAKPLIPQLEIASVRAIVERSVNESRAHEAFAGMQVELDIEESILVEVDPQIFGEVFTNLLRNAADACGGTGVVRIRARRCEVGYCIDVEDDGPGVPVHMRDEIFKPFRSSKSSGTGIGLAFSRKVIEAHGGSIGLVTRSGGTCFRIQLPEKAVVEQGSGVTSTDSGSGTD